MDIVRNSCPGAGACGGMYTANTMASAIEALGMTLPYRCEGPVCGGMEVLGRWEWCSPGRESGHLRQGRASGRVGWQELKGERDAGWGE